MPERPRKELALTPWFYWSPGNVFENMERMFGELNERLGNELLPVAMGTRMPAVDVKEEMDRYIVTADLPGMRKEDVSIEIAGDMIEISAKREEVGEERRDGYIRNERGSTRYFRRLPMPDDADPEQVRAKLEDGVLELNIMKLDETEGKKVKVQVE